MTTTGYLLREDRVVHGKVRKYYTITDEGQRALGESRRQIRELVHQVLEEHDPVSSVRPHEVR